jgi:hypothetical protein
MRRRISNPPPVRAITFFGSSARVRPGRRLREEARFLKCRPAVLVLLTVAATVLASPAPPVPSPAPPKGAVFLVLDSEDPAAGLARVSPGADATPRPEAFLRGLLAQFAVVKPHRTGPAASPGLQMFVLVAPMKGQVGVHAVGSF